MLVVIYHLSDVLVTVIQFNIYIYLYIHRHPLARFACMEINHMVMTELIILSVLIQYVSDPLTVMLSLGNSQNRSQ